MSQTDPTRRLRIATRESPLALWQARHIGELLGKQISTPEIVPMVSRGDVDMSPIDGTRTVGIFTKRIQDALLADEGDIAVHSMKDLPTEEHPDLVLAGTVQRETVADCLVTVNGVELNQLPKGANVGTGSRRRAAQLKRLRPDLNVTPIRGNVQTRLEKLNSGQYDAIVLAAAGIERLKLHTLPRVEMTLEVMLPAPGQGALAVETRRDDSEAIHAVNTISDERTMACITAERTMLAQLHGGCLAPIAGLSTIGDSGDQLLLHGRVLSVDGSTCLESKQHLKIDFPSESWFSTAVSLGKTVSDDLIGQGALELIQSNR